MYVLGGQKLAYQQSQESPRDMMICFRQIYELGNTSHCGQQYLLIRVFHLIA